jgi:hypothetical protein
MVKPGTFWRGLHSPVMVSYATRPETPRLDQVLHRLRGGDHIHGHFQSRDHVWCLCVCHGCLCGDCVCQRGEQVCGECPCSCAPLLPTDVHRAFGSRCSPCLICRGESPASTSVSLAPDQREDEDARMPWAYRRPSSPCMSRSRHGACMSFRVFQMPTACAHYWITDAGSTILHKNDIH